MRVIIDSPSLCDLMSHPTKLLNTQYFMPAATDMGEDDEFEKIPLTETDHALTSFRHQKSWRRHLPLLCWLIVIEALNALLFVGVPSIVARERQPRAGTPDECKCQPAKNSPPL